MVLQMLRSKMPLTESALKHAANDFQAFTPWQPLPTPHYRPPLTSPRSPRAQKGAQSARARPRARQMTGAGLAARAANLPVLLGAGTGASNFGSILGNAN